MCNLAENIFREAHNYSTHSSGSLTTIFLKLKLMKAWQGKGLLFLRCTVMRKIDDHLLQMHIATFLLSGMKN